MDKKINYKKEEVTAESIWKLLLFMLCTTPPSRINWAKKQVPTQTERVSSLSPCMEKVLVGCCPCHKELVGRLLEGWEREKRRGKQHGKSHKASEFTHIRAKGAGLDLINSICHVAA